MIVLYLIFVIFSLFVCIGFILLLIAQIWAEFVIAAPFIPIPSQIEEQVVQSLKLTKNNIFYDLGCGDGRVLIKAVEQNPEIKTVGVDIAFLPFLISKWKTRKYKNIQIIRKDFFKTDLKEATHIFVYLSSKMDELSAKIQKECRPGTRIVSCDFQFQNLKPIEIIDLHNPTSKRGQKLFVYQIWIGSSR